METVLCTLTIHIRLKSKQTDCLYEWVMRSNRYFWRCLWIRWRSHYVSGYLKCWCNLYRLWQNRYAQVHWWIVCDHPGTVFDGDRPCTFSFCGRKCDRIKAILKEPDGIVMIYKRLTAQGSYRWPRNKSEVRNLTWREFDWLMSGLDIEQPKAIKSTWKRCT